MRPLRAEWAEHEALLRKIFFTKAPKKVFSFYSFATRWVGPHVDEEVVGDYTVGLVLRGNHVLFTGNGRAVCKLEPGTVFLLNNKKLHGAKPAEKNLAEPLLFVTADFVAESDQHALSLCT